jgi:hypothetical protein
MTPVRKVAGKADEIGSRPAAGIEHPRGIRVGNDTETLFLDLPEQRDAGDQVKAAVACAGIAGAVYIAETGSKGLAGGFWHAKNLLMS